jgi:hypothetical protein
MIPEYYIIPQQALKRGKGTKNNIDVSKKEGGKKFSVLLFIKSSRNLLSFYLLQLHQSQL